MITNRQLIERLQQLPPDEPALIERGDWGPSYVREVREAIVRDSGSTSQNWEVFDLDTPDDEDDRPRLKVVLIG